MSPPRPANTLTVPSLHTFLVLALWASVLASGCSQPEQGPAVTPDPPVVDGNQTKVLWRNFTLQLTGAHAGGQWEHVGGAQGFSYNCIGFGNLTAAGLETLNAWASYAGSSAYVEDWLLRYAILGHGVEGEVTGPLPLEIEYNTTTQPLPDDLGTEPTEYLIVFVNPNQDPIATVAERVDLTVRLEVQSPGSLVIDNRGSWCS